MPANPSDTTRAHALLASLGIEHTTLEQAVARELAAVREERDAELGERLRLAEAVCDKALHVRDCGGSLPYGVLVAVEEWAAHEAERVARAFAGLRDSLKPPPAATKPCPECGGVVGCTRCVYASIPSAGAAGGTK